MSAPLRCAVCEVELTVADADHLVSTDAGPVHRECFEGPLPPGAELTAKDLAALDRAQDEAENDRRRDHGDPPLPPRTDEEVDAIFEREAEAIVNGEDDDGRDHYDPEDERSARELRDDEEYGGRYDETGIAH